MLIDIKSRVDDMAVVDILEYAVFPDDGALERTVHEYKTDSRKSLLGYAADEELIGLVGYTERNGIVEINHLAVKLQYRGLGYGRGILLELIDRIRPNRIIAETDDEAVDFYRNVGFTVSSLGEAYPGVERFKCEYEVDSERE